MDVGVIATSRPPLALLQMTAVQLYRGRPKREREREMAVDSAPCASQ